MKRFFKELLKLTFMGITIGLVVDLYKYVAHFMMHVSHDLFFTENVIDRTLAILFGIALIFVSYALIRWDHNIEGGGDRAFHLYTTHKNPTFKWYSALPLMFFNSCISFFLGLPLGSEPPAAFIGGTLGIATNEVFRDEDNMQDAQIGSGAGFSTAFLGPIAGLLYTFEEAMHHFSFKGLIKAIYVITISYFICLLPHPEGIIEISILNQFDYRFVWVFLFVILFNIVIGALFIIGSHLLSKVIVKHHDNPLIKYRYFIFTGFCFATYLICPILGGDGMLLVKYLNTNPAYWLIIGILIYRLIICMFAQDSMATGGLMLPILALGAMNGYLCSVIGTAIAGFDTIYYPLVILIGMTSLFAVTNKAPLTGAFLAISLAGDISLFPIIFPISLVVCFLGYLPMRFAKLDKIFDNKTNNI